MVISSAPESARAQSPLFPSGPRFETPAASPRPRAIAGRILAAVRGESAFGDETEGEAILGGEVPLVRLRGGTHPIALGVGAQIYGRFSLADPKSAHLSTDWLVSTNAVAALGDWRVALELQHESSHLGDEYAEQFHAARLDWTRNTIAGWTTWAPGPWRLTGGISYAVSDGLGLPPLSAAAGIDWIGADVAIAHIHLRPVVALYTDAAAATSWRLSNSARAGIVLGERGGRTLGFSLIAHDGLSTQRQFFRRESSYVGLEVRFDM